MATVPASGALQCPQVAESDHPVALLVPESEAEHRHALRQADRRRLVEDRVLVVDELQIVIGYARRKVVNDATDVACEPPARGAA
jgi:hypothetical protein